MNGLLVVDKSGGMTSHDVVNRVRRISGEPSVGHLGTLDPMATGVLPLLLGKYTRLLQFFGKMSKSYTGTIRFGFSTDTYDAEGIPSSAPSSPSLTLEQIRLASVEFHGEVDQTPPAFSAKKIDGKPAYKMAREGKSAVMRPVRITIEQFEILSLQGDVAEFAITVSAGGYVRSVAHDIGQILGCGAHLASLRRTMAGPFTLAEALTLDSIEQLAKSGNLQDHMPHPRDLLPALPGVTADEITIGRIRNGGAVNLPDFSAASLVKIFASQHELTAIGKRVAGTLFQPVVVLS
ncbi:MAG TPA: tRNA pseudouridine(55) synthase TruB [Acidisarcina sp.]